MPSSDTAVTLLVPLRPPYGCPHCLPVIRDYVDHSGLSRHVRRIHHGSLLFECRACGLTLDDLKALKQHQARNAACASQIPAVSPCSSRDPRQRERLPNPNSRRRHRVSTQVTATCAEGMQLVASMPLRVLQASPPMGNSTRRPPSLSNNKSPTTSSQPQHPAEEPVNQGPPLAFTGSPPVGPPATQVHTPSRAARRRCRTRRAPSTPSPPSASTTTVVPPAATPTSIRDSPQCSPAPATPLTIAPLPASVCQEPSHLSVVAHQAATTSCTPPTVPSALSTVPSWVTAWEAHFSSATDEDMLEMILCDFMSLVHNICDIDPTNQRRTIHPPPSQAPPSAQASYIQKLYRTNRKRAFDMITGAAPVPARHLLPLQLPFRLPLQPRQMIRSKLLSHPQRLLVVLRKGKNTAPGPDKVRYLHWQRVDPQGKILASIFNAVRRTDHIPLSWRTSSTILAFKKGNADEIRNWRPICLINTICKLYTACLADHLLLWCSANNRLSKAQKGFLHFERCLDHNFLFQSAIQDARRKRRNCYVAWLDIANAFGSIPHSVIWESLKWHGLHPDAITTIRRLYEGFSTSIHSSDGFTPPIQVQAGVKQGCPISPLLFNLALEPVIHQLQSLEVGYSLYNHKIDTLAYADNIALVCGSAEGLRSMLANISDWATWANISFNTHKCATLAISGNRNSDNSLTFKINDCSIPSLKLSEYYKHLGVPTGFARSNTEAEVFDSILRDANCLDASRLAPWQKINALKTFVLSRLPFHLTLGSTLKRTLDKIDITTKKLVKKWLGLPQRASPEVAFLPPSQGGAGVMPTTIVGDIAQVSHVLHLFDSTDPAVSNLAVAALNSVVEQRIRRPPSISDLCQFLNSSLPDDSGCTDFSSVWTRLRMATRRLRKKLNIEWCDAGLNTPSLTYNDCIIKKQLCHRNLSSLMSLTFLESLLRKLDQGKVFHITAGNPASNHFLGNTGTTLGLLIGASSIAPG
ncbi:uncharacterized protein [Centruroides vittatus]|uniref:uncharacterized protein n=1 Tax=Centruroides vittatus TaxID=120091 RepID=UPI00350F07DC